MNQAVLLTLLGVGVTGAFGAIGWLVRTVIRNAQELGAIKQEHVKEDSELKLWAVQRFVAREDYSPQVSLMQHKLDSMGEMIARVDERLKA